MDIEKKFIETVENYELADKNEKVVVALSGGKDSTSLLYLFHKFGFNVSGLMIDLHLGEWSKKNRENMEKFCSDLNVPLEIVDLKKEFGQGICFIKSVVKKQKNLTGCTVCGVMKKWILNKWAKKLKADKIATGHNLDDEAQTVLMNFLKGNVFLGANSSPATGRKGEKGFVQRIKPLFFVPENEIRKYSKKMKLPVLYERCPCAMGTYRVETRAWLDKISDKEKMKVVEAWQEKIPELRKEQKDELKVCVKCGEPASNDVCKACGILECFTTNF